MEKVTRSGNVASSDRIILPDGTETTVGDQDLIISVVEDNTDFIANAINETIVKAMEEIGLVAEGYAKLACPVDTGRLRNSITHELISETEVAIGTNVEYAEIVEVGGKNHSAQPYLKPAAADHASTYRDIIKNNLESA